MLKEPPTLGTGALVDVRGNRWRVVEKVEHEGCSSCRLAGAAASNLGVHRTLLLPFDRLRPVEPRTRPKRVGRRRWVAGLRSLLEAASTADGLRGAAGAAIDLFDYQLEPALACARGATRILLADDVGLGKTIQAGLILADLRARDDSVRALVLCPAGLCAQWLRELEDRFHLAADLADRAALRSRFLFSSTGIGPWEQMPIAVASVDFVKQPEILRGMAQLRWDLLVVDEAHLCALAPERAVAVNWLASRARRVLLMTATPHSGEPGAFEALCRIGQLPGEGPVLMFRRSRADLGLTRARHCRILAVTLSATERRLHALLERYTSRVWETASADRSRDGARLAMIVLRKRAASGAASLLASLTRRLRGLTSPADAAAAQLPLPFDDDDGREASDDEPGEVLAAPGLAEVEVERRILERLIVLAADAVEHDAKSRALVRFLRRAREPAIVFTEYRDTLSRLADVCGPDARVAVIHGGMDRRARADAVRAFDRGAANLLLATDAAAHGLNLQSRCRLVVTLELPWNPVRLEQRIGRVDRIGQRRTVHAVHLVARQTSEERTLARLVVRIERTRKVMGPGQSPLGAVSESEIAAAVFARRSLRTPVASVLQRESPPWMQPEDDAGAQELVVRHGLPVEAREETARLEKIRALGSRQRRDPEKIAAALVRTGPWWTTLRLKGFDVSPPGAPGSAVRGGIVALFDAEVIDGRGLLLERILVALRCAPPGLSRSACRWVTDLLGPDGPAMAALGAEAERCASRRLAELREIVRPRLSSGSRRELAIAIADDRVPVAACQPGLFDRRALRQADEDRQASALRRQEAKARTDADLRTSNLSLAGPPRLVLVAVLRSRACGSPRGEGG